MRIKLEIEVDTQDTDPTPEEVKETLDEIITEAFDTRHIWWVTGLRLSSNRPQTLGAESSPADGSNSRAEPKLEAPASYAAN